MSKLVVNLMKIIDSELFICLRQMCGESYQDFMMNKLIPVAGNVCEPNLGMSADLAAEVANEVDVIVNSAANTCFDERLSISQLELTTSSST